jgi:hypothetical protein
MIRIFISHSSTDDGFCQKLAEDLRCLGYDPWLDKDKISVGQSIPVEISRALEACRYLIIVLSDQAVKSKWVETEWAAKLWQEIDRAQIAVLPVLKDKCQIPAILKPKRYADFTDNYAVGLVQLTSSMSRTVPNDQTAPIEMLARASDDTGEIAALLERVQSRKDSVSECLAAAINIAQRENAVDLLSFCKRELGGYERFEQEELKKLGAEYRLVQVYISTKAAVNRQYVGWQTTEDVMEFLRTDDDFYPRKLFISYPISNIERQISTDPRTMLLHFSLKIGDFLSDAKDPEAPVNGYAQPGSLAGIVDAVRSELTTRLIALLP